MLFNDNGVNMYPTLTDIFKLYGDLFRIGDNVQYLRHQYGDDIIHLNNSQAMDIYETAADTLDDFLIM